MTLSFVDGLSVIGHRTVRVDGDGHRAHAEESERHQAEREDGGRLHESVHALRADAVCDGHQAEHRNSEPVAAEVPGDQSGENVGRCAAFSRRSDHFPHVGRINRGKDFYELRDNRSGKGAASDDGGKLPPCHGRIVADLRDHQVAEAVSCADGNDRGEPHQSGKRSLIVHLVHVLILGLGDGFVNEVGKAAGDDHHDAHGEDPNQ